MSEVAPSQLQKKHDKVRNAITAKNREKRMRNLNITYAKCRKRRRTVNNNSRCSSGSAANVSLEEGLSSPIVERTVYHCPYCSFWHQTLDGFHGHLTKNHQQGDQTYQCTYCHLTADSRRDIWNHIHRLSQKDSVHKRATCLVRSENLIERYAVYLKTVQVPASAKCGQLSQNSISVNDSFPREPIKNIELTPDSENSPSFETDEDLLTFDGSPISMFTDVTVPLVDCVKNNSSFGLQLDKVQLMADEDSIGSIPKKRRIDENLKNDLRILNKSEINNTSNTLSGIRRISKQADSESEKDTLQSHDNLLNRSKQRHRQSNENMFQTNGSCGSSESDLVNDDSDLDTRAPSSSSSSEYSDWSNETEVNLEPPRFTRASISKPRLRRNSDKKPIRACDVLFSLTPRRLPFYPQIGDEVVYFRQGHELYLDIVKQKKLYKFNPRSLPWYSETIGEQEFVKIIGIKYEIKPQMTYFLKLGCMDPATRTLTGKSFIVKYHDIEEVLDFFVLQQDYDLAIQRTWQPGDCFRSVVRNVHGIQVWWEGLIEEREPLSNQFPDSPFLCYRIRWKNNKLDRASPWDLEKPDPNRRPTNHEAGVGTLPQEISNLLYKPLAEEWSPIGDRDTECDRISAGFNKVMDMYVAKHFLVPVNLELYPTYASVVKYPMDLSTIKARLESRFYRRVSAVQYDVRRIYINAFKFNLPTSDIVRNSSVVSDLCLEIIRNKDSNDVKALYQQVLEKYRIRDEKEEKAAEQIRNAEKDKTLDDPKPKKSKRTTLATTSDPCWKQQCKGLLEILKQSEDAVLFSELAKVQDEPDYLQVMDYPMDLETVHEELRLNSYATPIDFARDIRVIFENSKSYFTNKKSRNWCMTARLSAVFEEHIRKILTSFKQPGESPNQSVGSKSKDDNSKEHKSFTPMASTNETVQEVGDTIENNNIISRHTNKEQAVVEASSSTQLADADEQISVCNASVIDGADGVNERNTDIPDTSFERDKLVDKKKTLLSEKEQSDIDIESGYRDLETIKADIQKDIQLLSEEQQQINAHYSTLLEHGEDRDGSDAKTSKVSKLTSLLALKKKINGQLVHCTKQKLTQELSWREHQATALKLELRLNLLDPCENALEFRTVEKMLAEKRNHEIQSEGELNLTKGEIVALEKEQKDMDRQISDLKAMHDKMTEMETRKTAIQLQILNKKSKENDLIEDLTKRITAWKTLEMKLIQILYEEAIGDIEKIAKEKFNKLNQLVEGSLKR